MAINLASVGKQLSGFVGQNVSPQFSMKPKKLAEGDTVEDSVAMEQVTYERADGSKVTYKYNPETHSKPRPDGQMRRLNVNPDDVARVGGLVLFDTAETVDVPAEATGQVEEKVKEEVRETPYTSSDVPGWGVDIPSGIEYEPGRQSLSMRDTQTGAMNQLVNKGLSKVVPQYLRGLLGIDEGLKQGERNVLSNIPAEYLSTRTGEPVASFEDLTEKDRENISLYDMAFPFGIGADANNPMQNMERDAIAYAQGKNRDQISEEDIKKFDAGMTPGGPKGLGFDFRGDFWAEDPKYGIAYNVRTGMDERGLVVAKPDWNLEDQFRNQTGPYKSKMGEERETSTDRERPSWESTRGEIDKTASFVDPASLVDPWATPPSVEDLIVDDTTQLEKDLAGDSTSPSPTPLDSHPLYDPTNMLPQISDTEEAGTKTVAKELSEKGRLDREEDTTQLEKDLASDLAKDKGRDERLANIAKLTPGYKPPQIHSPSWQYKAAKALGFDKSMSQNALERMIGDYERKGMDPTTTVLPSGLDLGQAFSEANFAADRMEQAPTLADAVRMEQAYQSGFTDLEDPSDGFIDWGDGTMDIGSALQQGGPVRFNEGGLASISNQHLEPGSFVVAADVMSGLGDGSSEAGFERLSGLLGIPLDNSASIGGPMFGKVEGTGTGLDDMIHTTIQSSDGKSGKQAARVAREEAVLTPESLRYIDKHFGTGKGDLGNAHKMFANLQQNVRNQKTGGRQPGPLIKEGASVEKGLSQLFQKA